MGRLSIILMALVLFTTGCFADSCKKKCNACCFTPAMRYKITAALMRKGYDPEEIDQYLAAAEMRVRMKQAKYGPDFVNSQPWWPNDPRYPVPYLFYREGQLDYGFGRW